LNNAQQFVQAHCNPRSCGCKELSRQRSLPNKKNTIGLTSGMEKPAYNRVDGSAIR
tara:strand:+ start:10823 stop:10990 length:168 start_codon:yes stop_codon:yes gene_type:complete